MNASSAATLMWDYLLKSPPTNGSSGMKNGISVIIPAPAPAPSVCVACFVTVLRCSNYI